MKINNFISWTINEDEVIIINSYNQKCIILDSIASEIWKEVIEEDKEEEIINKIAIRYDSSEIENIKKDITEFISLLQENEIIA